MDRVANLPTTSEEEDPLRPLLNRADLEPKRQTQKSVRVALHGSGNGKRVFNLGVLVKEVTLSLDDLKRFTCVDYPHGSRTSILALANEPQMIGTTIKTMRSLRVSLCQLNSAVDVYRQDSSCSSLIKQCA